MDYEDCSSSTSSSSSSSTSLPTIPSPKRKAGRKKFRETRHPVYRGVRKRGKAGKWVCEVREPNKKSRIWLGTYPTPDMAARAHDVAAIALRGKSAELNFADSAWLLPRAESVKADDIRRAAANAAEMFRPDGSGAAAAAQQWQSQSQSPLPPPLQQLTLLSDTGTSATEVFVDEDAMLDMPGLLRDMAEGMMLTPPAIQLTGFDWDEVECHMDMSLWSL